MSMMQSALRAGLARAPGAARSFSSTAPAEATLRDIETRIKSVKNIGKITSSMKMVAAARLPSAERARKTAVAYGDSSNVLTKSLNLNETPFAELPYDKEAFPDAKELLVPISSDRGLCGSIHSALSKSARAYYEKNIAEGVPTDVVVLGEKPRSQLVRAIPQALSYAFTGLGRGVPTFDEALAIAQIINSSETNYAKITLLYNSYVSAVSNDIVTSCVYPPQVFAQSEDIQRIYDVSVEPQGPDEAEPHDNAYEAFDVLGEYQLANAIYAAAVDAFCAEMSARRNAMDNASKNAGDMADGLQMQYNRMRQATITNELVDIITGASAL